MAGLKFTKAESVPDHSILSMMAVDIAINEDSKICIMHDRPFPVPVDHIEFHDQTGDLYFVGKDGSMRSLGMTVPRHSRQRMTNAHCAHCLLIREKSVSSHRIVPVIHKKEMS